MSILISSWNSVLKSMARKPAAPFVVPVPIAPPPPAELPPTAEQRQADLDRYSIRMIEPMGVEEAGARLLAYRRALELLVQRIDQCGSYRQLMASEEFKEARRVIGRLLRDG